MEVRSRTSTFVGEVGTVAFTVRPNTFTADAQRIADVRQKSRDLRRASEIPKERP